MMESLLAKHDGNNDESNSNPEIWFDHEWDKSSKQIVSWEDTFNIENNEEHCNRKELQKETEHRVVVS